MTPKHSGGRPHVDKNDDSIQVGLTLPSRQYDAFARRALREGVSVPEIIRQELREVKEDRRAKDRREP